MPLLMVIICTIGIPWICTEELALGVSDHEMYDVILIKFLVSDHSAWAVV
jgi:hypothetical protein